MVVGTNSVRLEKEEEKRDFTTLLRPAGGTTKGRLIFTDSH
jgi:hypothetical protein